MFKVGVVSLDSRPINTTQLELFCKTYSINAEFYPFKMLGSKSKGAEFEEIVKWILSTGCEEYLISLNSMCCGGLVQSRNLTEQHIINAGKLKDCFIHKKCRYGLVLPRVAPTVVDVSSFLKHREVTRSETDLLPDTDKIEKWQRFLSAIPQPECVVQEDTCKDSLTSKTMFDLVTKSIPDYSYYANGGDELLYILLARAETERLSPLKFNIVYTFPEGRYSVCKFEHLTLNDNVTRLTKYLNISAQNSSNEDLPTIMINNNISNDADCIDKTIDPNEKQISKISKLLLNIDRSDMYIADIAQANGGDPCLWNAMSVFNHTINAYSGWNTAMNSIGTLFATAVLEQNSRETVSNEWLIIRILDDYIYQTIVRPKLSENASANKWDIWNLPQDALPELQSKCLRMMKEEYNQLKSSFTNLPEIPDFNVSFPWNRLFELDILFQFETRF